MNTKRRDWIEVGKGSGIMLDVLGQTIVTQDRE